MVFGDEYLSPQPYLAYTRATNEKEKLHQHILSCLRTRRFPVKWSSRGGRILDVGCGNGVNALFLAQQFPNNRIDAIDRSSAQITFARRFRTMGNIHYINSELEEFTSSMTYKFILVSHVLQYINSSPETFVSRVLSFLRSGYQAWFVQHTREGLFQIIQHQQPLLTNPRFRDWKTFEDYEVVIRRMLEGSSQFTVDTAMLDSSIDAIDFGNPSYEDKLRLEFMLLLGGPFDQQSDDFKRHLAKLQLGDGGRIRHPNGILKVTRRG